MSDLPEMRQRNLLGTRGNGEYANWILLANGTKNDAQGMSRCQR